MDRGAWLANVPGVAKSETTEWLSLHFTSIAYKIKELNETIKRENVDRQGALDLALVVPPILQNWGELKGSTKKTVDKTPLRRRKTTEASVLLGKWRSVTKKKDVYQMMIFFQERCYVTYFIKPIDSLITWLSLVFKVKIFKNKQKLYFPLLLLCPTHCNHAQFPCLSPSPRAFSDWAMLSNHLTLCCPLLSPLSIFPSIRVFFKDAALCIRWPKYWGFSFSISPSNQYSGLMDGLLWPAWSPRDSQDSSPAPQLESISASVLNLLYDPSFTSNMTTRKTIALMTWTFASKVISQIFNMLSQFVILPFQGVSVF